MEAYLIVILDIEFDLFARQGPHPIAKSAISTTNAITFSKKCVGLFVQKREGARADDKLT